MSTGALAAEVASPAPDYRTDRGFSGMAFSVFSRVYPGRMPTRNCSGTRSDGMAGEVVFVQNGAEWRIEQM